MFSIHSPLIINSDLKTIFNIFNSEKFIKYVFSIDKTEKNNSITINNDNIHIVKNYIVSEFINNNLEINDYVKNNLIDKIKDLEITLEISQSIIKNDDNTLIIKYICYIDKPPYIKTMLADQNTVYYIKIYKKTYENQKNLSVVNYYRRFIPTNDPELYNDEFILNDNIDITTIDNKYDTIKFNEALILTAKTFLGQETLDNIIIPFIYNIFDDFINKYLIKKIKKYFKKNEIPIYTKK